LKEVTINIDGAKIQAVEGETLLSRALKEDIFIPSLCAIEDIEPAQASCRLCYVEVQGKAHPVPSCTTKVVKDMVVTTRTEAVDRLVASGFEMLMSVQYLQWHIG